MSNVVNLVKGEKVSLEKISPGLKAVMVGLGWDAKTTVGSPIDLDAFAFLLDASGKCPTGDHFVRPSTYGTTGKSPDENVCHMGDNQTGEGEGDDEQIMINLEDLDPNIQKVVLAVIIYDGVARGQNFGQVQNAFVRLVNMEEDAEIARFDLTEDGGIVTCMIFAEIYRHNGEWKMTAVGQGYADGIETLVREYGLSS